MVYGLRKGKDAEHGRFRKEDQGREAKVEELQQEGAQEEEDSRMRGVLEESDLGDLT